MASDDMLIDQTTYYSILGLKSDASESQIKKAYRKIAVVIHPDKNKSVGAAELFKIVSHAQSVLTDEVKRREYNRKLIAKNLHNYIPLKTKLGPGYGISNASVESKDAKQSSATEVEAAKTVEPTNQKPRRSRPYEQQPYGFGLEERSKETRNSQNTKSSNFKPFKAKSYQHQRPSSETKDEHKKSSTYSTRFASYSKSSNTTDDHHAEQTPVNDNQRIKIPKKEPKSAGKSTPEQPTSPFISNHHRHYTRTMHHDKQQSRRSASPVKGKPTSSRDTLEDVRNIMKQFSAERFTPSRSEEAGFGETETEPDRRGIQPQSEPTDMPLRRNSTPSKTYGNKIAVKNEKRQDDPTSPSPTSARKKPNLGNTSTETSAIKSSRQGRHLSDFKLDDLNKYLPKDEEFFDMRNVSDTLENVRVKRFKPMKEDTPEIDMLAEGRRDEIFAFPQPTENLSRPVNAPLPRIYKPDLLSDMEMGLDPSVSLIQLPPLPVLHFNILDKAEVARIKEAVKRYNIETNETKRRLIDVLLKRSTADELFNDRLTRVENATLFVQAKSYDLDIVTKINELQNRQRIVAETFSNLMKSIYASGGV